MLRDPLIAYALHHGTTDHSLVQLAEREFDPSTAADAFNQLLIAATAGSPFAMSICSALLREGRGVEKSERAALSWAQKAASSGFAPGLYELARCFEHGIGVHIDTNRAIELYDEASASGYGFAAYRLGKSYYYGDLVEADLRKAVEYMERAYELGDFHGAHDLAEWYESGEKLSRHYSAAVLWYERASSLGDPFSSFRLQMAYSRGELGLQRDAPRAREYEQLFMKQTEPPSCQP
jgi:uncharacterized protein